VIFAETSLGPSESTSEYRVSVDGQNETFISVAQQGSTAAAPIWNQRSLTFTASDDSSDLRFESLAAGADGVIIGDIRVVEVPEAISTILNSDPSLSYDAATGKFYRFIDVRSTYEEASSNAFGSALNGVSGQLVNIDTEYENTLVNQYVQAVTKSVNSSGLAAVAELALMASTPPLSGYLAPLMKLVCV